MQSDKADETIIGAYDAAIRQYFRRISGMSRPAGEGGAGLRPCDRGRSMRSGISEYGCRFRREKRAKFNLLVALRC